MDPKIRKGQILIAMPGLNDPNFLQTVVFLCNDGADGAIGVILNRPTEITVSAFIRDCPGLPGTERIFEGGPVAKSGLLLLCRGEKAKEEDEIAPDISLARDLNALRARDPLMPYQAVRCYMGYAGWTQGQLEAEIKTGSWKIMPADSALIFDLDPLLLWPQMMQRLGSQYAFYATMPMNPSMN